MTLDLVTIINVALATITSGGLLAGARWARRTTRTLDRLSDVITPAGQPSLAATVNGHEIRISLNSAEIAHLKEALT